MDVERYVRIYWWPEGRDPPRRPKVPRAVERDLLERGPPELAALLYGPRLGKGALGGAKLLVYLATPAVIRNAAHLEDGT